jgi:hypothetical protein
MVRTRDDNDIAASESSLETVILGDVASDLLYVMGTIRMQSDQSVPLIHDSMITHHSSLYHSHPS